MELKPGMRVRFTDTETGGWFDATVERLITVGEYRKDPTVDGAHEISQAVLRPISQSLRDYFAGTYPIGHSHWGSCLTVLPSNIERGTL